MNDSIPCFAKKIVIIAGGNNLQHDPPIVIADAVIHIAKAAQSKCAIAQIYVAGILPREDMWISTKAAETNSIIECKCTFLNINFIPVDPLFFAGW